MPTIVVSGWRMGRVDDILDQIVPAVWKIAIHPWSIHNTTVIIIDISNALKAHLRDGGQLRENPCVRTRCRPYIKKSILDLGWEGVAVTLWVLLDPFKLGALSLWYDSKLAITLPAPSMVGALM